MTTFATVNFIHIYFEHPDPVWWVIIAQQYYEYSFWLDVNVQETFY